MKIVSFNVNSVRSRIHQLTEVVEKHQPEIIALQETKVQDHDFPQVEIEALGYTALWFGQKTHYGVALLSRCAPFDAQYGFASDGDAAQRRLIAASYQVQGELIRVVNGYFPQGESRDHPVKFPNKARFYADLYNDLSSWRNPAERLLVVGDMNVAPQDLDIGIGEQNAKRWLRETQVNMQRSNKTWSTRSIRPLGLASK